MRMTLWNDSKSSSKNNSDERNSVGRMRHERKEQPGMEMGKEIRTFHEKGRRGALRHPFGVGWWTPGSTGWETSTKVLVEENTEQPRRQRLEKLDSQAVLLLPAASFYWSEIINF